jgi:antitoxin component YwqK of YwqJK toxin-antitoxin module
MSLKQPEKIRVNFDDLERYGQTAEVIYSYQGKLFTGYAVLDYFPNSTDIEAEIEFKNGVEIGWQNVYYPNGQLASSYLCYRESSIEFFKYNENGDLINSGRVVSEDRYDDMVKRYNMLD